MGHVKFKALIRYKHRVVEKAVEGSRMDSYERSELEIEILE